VPGRAATPGHSEGVREAHERMLAASAGRSRTVELRSGGSVPVVEAGEGPPLVLLHGSGTSSLSLLAVLDRLEGVRALAPDRPGFGLSDPAPVPRERFRAAAIAFVDGLLDALGLQESAVGGSSMGGTWALWHALAHPDRVSRLVLLGSAPLLPGTRAPAALRVMSAPVFGDLLGRVAKPNRKAVVRFLGVMGEKDTIVRHPGLVDAQVAAGADPVAASANLAELRACMTPIAFRRSAFLRPDELRRLRAPTLIVWGDHDPVGGPEVAHAVAQLIPEARLELLPGGHVPYLGDPGRVARLVSAFVRGDG
jgi:pimeloyl-ACP methyl ester carboxylesterase